MWGVKTPADPGHLVFLVYPRAPRQFLPLDIANATRQTKKGVGGVSMWGVALVGVAIGR